MVTKLRDRYKPTQNQVLLHFQFNSLIQEPEESIDTFINRVKQHARHCEFKCQSAQCKVSETLIRDRIIIGTNNKNIREDALEKEYTLTELEKQARKIEATETAASQINNQKTSLASSQISQIQSEEEHNVHAIKHGKYSRRNSNYQQSSHNANRAIPPNQSTNNNTTAFICCGNTSCKRDAKCPARGQMCNGCGTIGHFKRCCRSSTNSTTSRSINTWLV